MSKVAKNARFKDYNGCVEWLEMAGMVNVADAFLFPNCR